MKIERVQTHQVPIALELLHRVADWLRAKGRRQRIAKTTDRTYLEWQKQEANYFVRDDEAQVVGVFSLPWEHFTEWPNMESEKPVPWIRSLATDPDHRNKGIGAFAVHESFNLVGEGETIYLDCVSDFLPEYYQSLGFEIIATQARDYPDEPEPLEITLLCKQKPAHKGT